MIYPEFTAIKGSCLVLKKAPENEQLVRVVKMDELQEGVGYAQCEIPAEVIALIPGLWGRRNVTAVSSLGCPLREGVPVKVNCPAIKNNSS